MGGCWILDYTHIDLPRGSVNLIMIKAIPPPPKSKQSMEANVELTRGHVRAPAIVILSV